MLHLYTHVVRHPRRHLDPISVVSMDNTGALLSFPSFMKALSAPVCGAEDSASVRELSSLSHDLVIGVGEYSVVGE